MDAVLDPDLGGGGGVLCFFSFSGYFSYSCRWILCKLKEEVQRKQLDGKEGGLVLKTYSCYLFKCKIVKKSQKHLIWMFLETNCDLENKQVCLSV